jgi:hypothetical protein
MSALQAYFGDGFTTLTLAVARDGFQDELGPVGGNIPGGSELADDLRAQGVAVIEFQPTITGEEVLALLTTLSRPPAEIHAEGGFGVVGATAGMGSIRVTDVQLTVLDAGGFGEADDESVLRGMLSDAARLGQWMGTAAAGDPEALKDGVLQMASVAGTEGDAELAETLSDAFLSQNSDSRDTVLSLAMEPGPFRDLIGDMFCYQDSAEIAESILGGQYGRNMMALSTALTQLPLGQIDDDVRKEVLSLLPGAGVPETQTDFLQHMLQVRLQPEPEPDLVAVDRTYQAVVQAASITDGDLEKARNAVEASSVGVDAASVRTLLALLDHETDFAKYAASIDSLAGMVPRFIENDQLPLAAFVLVELDNRRASDLARWPQLAENPNLGKRPADSKAMAVLVDSVLADPALMPQAREIVRLLGETSGQPIVDQAITHKAEGIRLAEELLGRRVIDLLCASVMQAQWFQVGAVVARLAAEGSPSCVATIEALMRKPDPGVRKEVVAGLSQSPGPVADRLLPELVRDENADVTIAAARVLAKSPTPGAGAAIAARLGQLDVDNNDFELARELISTLSLCADPAAGDALKKLATRRSLMKRGHFNEITQAATAALQVRTREGAGR